MLDLLTAELGDLVADATGLPTSIDPIRPPQVPGCFVGPPSIQPDAETGGKLLLAQWEIGVVLPATTGAWTPAAEYGEAVGSAVIAHPTLGLVEVKSRLFALGDGGEAPGYRIDVALLLHQDALQPLEPPLPPVTGAATMTSTAALAAAGEPVGIPVITGAATLSGTAALAAAGEAVAPAVITGAAALTATAALAAAGTVIAAGPAPPAGYISLFDATSLALTNGAAVATWADTVTVAPPRVWTAPSTAPSFVASSSMGGAPAVALNGAANTPMTMSGAGVGGHVGWAALLVYRQMQDAAFTPWGMTAGGAPFLTYAQSGLRVPHPEQQWAGVALRSFQMGASDYLDVVTAPADGIADLINVTAAGVMKRTVFNLKTGARLATPDYASYTSDLGVHGGLIHLAPDAGRSALLHVPAMVVYPFALSAGQIDALFAWCAARWTVTT